MSNQNQNPFADFNDDLDTVINAPLANAVTLPANYKPQVVEACPKCNGTGRFVAYSGRVLGPCFKCKGAGKRTFVNPREVRQANTAKAAERRVAKAIKTADENVAAFAAAEPEVYAWLKGNTGNFAVSLVRSLGQFGSLTQPQIDAVKRGIARDVERKAEAEVRKANAPAVDTAGVDRLKEAFAKASAYVAEKGLKRDNPTITIGNVTLKPAKAHSTNPGAIYVNEGDVYLGKIVDGKFFTRRECTAEIEKQVLEFIADPQKAAEVYGQTSGTCCICNAKLISKWKYRGIGPICATKFGW